MFFCCISGASIPDHEQNSVYCTASPRQRIKHGFMSFRVYYSVNIANFLTLLKKCCWEWRWDQFISAHAHNNYRFWADYVVMVVNIILVATLYFRAKTSEKWDASLSKKIVPFAGLTGCMFCQRVSLLSLRFATTSRTKWARSRGAAPSEGGGHERSERNLEHRPPAASHGGLRFKLRYVFKVQSSKKCVRGGWYIKIYL